MRSVLDLFHERFLLRLTGRDSQTPGVIQVCRTRGKETGDPLCEFPCSRADLAAVLDGRPYQVNDERGFLLMRPAGSKVWFVISVRSHNFEESCLVECAAIERAIACLNGTSEGA